MGCQARWDLERLRGRARATELGLVAVDKRPAPPQRAWQPMFSMLGVYGAPPRHALICSGEGGESIVVPGGDERGKGQW